MTGLVSTAEVLIAAPVDRVWKALTEPAKVKQWMFGTDLETDWRPGSPISWTGEWEGKPFRDEGEVIEVVPNEKLVLTHTSGSSGGDSHTIVYTLSDHDGHTDVTLTQDSNGSQKEADQATKNWSMMLAGMKKVVESG